MVVLTVIELWQIKPEAREALEGEPARFDEPPDSAPNGATLSAYDSRPVGHHEGDHQLTGWAQTAEE